MHVFLCQLWSPARRHGRWFVQSLGMMCFRNQVIYYYYTQHCIIFWWVISFANLCFFLDSLFVCTEVHHRLVFVHFPIKQPNNFGGYYMKFTIDTLIYWHTNIYHIIARILQLLSSIYIHAYIFMPIIFGEAVHTLKWKATVLN